MTVVEQQRANMTKFLTEIDSIRNRCLRFNKDGVSTGTWLSDDSSKKSTAVDLFKRTADAVPRERSGPLYDHRLPEAFLATNTRSTCHERIIVVTSDHDLPR